MGIARTNQEVSFSGINIYTFEGDKLSESQVAWDLLGLLAAKPEVGDMTNTYP